MSGGIPAADLGRLALLVQEIERHLGCVQDTWLGLREGILPEHGALPEKEDPDWQKYSPRVIPSIEDQKAAMGQLKKGLGGLKKTYEALLELSEEEKATRKRLLSKVAPPPPPPPTEPEAAPEPPQEPPASDH